MTNGKRPLTIADKARVFEDRRLKTLLDVAGELVVEWHCQLRMSDSRDFYRFCGSKP
jgi:hypothetical protein